MNALTTKIENFLNVIGNEHDAHVILNQILLTLSESKKYGIDAITRTLYCTIDNTNGWESNDGVNHLAVICVKNDDSQEHCFGEWLENAQGVIVLEPSRDNEDAIQKAVSYLKTQGYEVSTNKDTENEKIFKAIEYLRTQEYVIIDTKSKDKGYEHAKDFLQSMGAMVYADYECEMEDAKDCGYLIVKDGDKYSSSIDDMIEYMEFHNYKVFHENESIPEYLRNDGWYVTDSQHFEAWATDIFKNIGFIVIDTNKPIDVDAINKSLAPKNFKVFPSDSYQSIIEHLTKEDYFVCQGGSDVESLVQLFHKEPEKFSNILMKSYKFKIDVPIKFDIDFEVKAFTLKDAHIKMRDRLENACLDVNNSQTYAHINADDIQIIPL